MRTLSTRQRLDVRDSVGSSGNGLLARLAGPDANAVTLDGDFAAECAGVSRVLCDFHLLHLLTERGTITAKRVSRPFLSTFTPGAGARVAFR